MPSGDYAIPNLHDLAVRADPEGGAHNSHKGLAQKTLHAPRAVRFDHFEFRVGQQREIQIQLLAEFRLRLDVVRAHSSNFRVLRLEIRDHVAEAVRFVNASRSVGLRIKIQNQMFAAIVGERYLAPVVRQHFKMRCLIAFFQHDVSPSALPTSVSPRVRRGLYASASTRFRISFTICGLACPRVSFITCPTKNLKTPSLPARYFARLSGLLAITTRAIFSIALVSEICAMPSATIMSAAFFPVSNMLANTFLPLAVVISPRSTIASSPAS